MGVLTTGNYLCFTSSLSYQGRYYDDGARCVLLFGFYKRLTSDLWQEEISGIHSFLVYQSEIKSRKRYSYTLPIMELSWLPLPRELIRRSIVGLI